MEPKIRKISLLGIAESPEELEQGLQHVRAMDDMSGMLFRFKHPRVLSFWMKNTYIPLEIAFVDEKNTIIKTESMIPHSLRSVTSGRPCQIAIEVPYGTLAKLEAAVGTKVDIDWTNKAVTFG